MFNRYQSFAVAAIVASSLAGCARQIPQVPTSVEAPKVIEGGIVFDDSRSYLCWPFDKLGLDESTEVASVTTSCECVLGEAVAYQRSKDKVSKAILLKFPPEEEQHDQPANLSVIVTVKTNAGVSKEFTVNILRTNRVSQ